MLPIAHSQWQEHTDFGIEKTLTATSASSVTRALYCPGRRAHGPLRQLPGQHQRIKGASVTASMALPAARMRVCPSCFGQRLKRSPRCSGRPASFPRDHGIQGSRRSPFAQESERQRAGSRGNASRVPACKLLFARTEPIRSAPFSRAGNGKGPWQPQALS